MKSLINYIKESKQEDPKVWRFWRANIGKECNTYNGTQQIGDVTPITCKYFSNYSKKWTYGEPKGKNDWRFACEIESHNVESTEAFEKYTKTLNNEFYQYFLDETEAKDVASHAKQEYVDKKWTLESLLKAIKSYAPLTKLGYNYRITDTYQNKNSKASVESIYVSGAWRILLKDNEIFVENAGWHTYKVPNIPSLYKVLNAENGKGDSSDIETERQQYGIVK